MDREIFIIAWLSRNGLELEEERDMDGVIETLADAALGEKMGRNYQDAAYVLHTGVQVRIPFCNVIKMLNLDQRVAGKAAELKAEWARDTETLRGAAHA